MVNIKSCGRNAALFAMVAIAVVQAGATPVHAQHIGGVFDLMGRLIEQDMRNEQIKREQRQYEAEQRALRAEQTRRQIALVKRLQMALQSLGFYSSKIDGDRGAGTRAAEQRFAMAFGVAPLDLTEEVVAEIEGLASAGFRSADEMRRASSLGYASRQDLLDGDAGGFNNAAEFVEARQRGFSHADQYRAFRKSGFSSVDVFREAQASGFDSSNEFEAARSKGFSSKRDYEDFLRSGLADRSTFEAKREQIAALQRALDRCFESGSEMSVDAITDALEACLQAVSSGERTARLTSAMDRIDLSLDNYEKELDGASQNPATASGAPSPLLPASAAHDRLRDMRAARACASSVLAQDWGTAQTSCASSSSPFAMVSELKAKADDAVAQQQKLAAEQAEKARASANEERKRLALAAARQRMDALIGDVADFTAAKRSLVKPLDIAKAFVTLKALERSEDHDAIEQAILKVDALLKDEPDYAAFLDERNRAQQIAQTNARATALSELQRTAKFIEDHVARNLLSPVAGDLLALQGRITSAVSGANDETIFSMQKEATDEIGRLSLARELAAFRVDEPKSPAPNVEQAANGLAVTDASRPLLTGDPRDVLILGNFAKSAPHLVVNLLGETTFYQAVADYCWYRARGAAPAVSADIVAALRAFGAETLNSRDRCSKSTPATDVILLERGDFLQGDVTETRPLVDAFIERKLRIMQTLLWSELGEAKAQAAAEAARVRTEVLAGARKGFGFISVKSAAGTLCTIPSGEAHQLAMSGLGEAFDRFKAANPQMSVKTTEQAFIGIQRDECSAIYAAAADLKLLIEAFDRAGIACAVQPFWLDEASIAAAENSLKDKVATDQQRLASLKQEQEARALQARKAAEDEKVRLAGLQDELRARYGQEAKAAFDGLSRQSKAFLMAERSDEPAFPLLFPGLAEWKTKQFRDGWEPEKYSDQLLDYGTGDWKGRRLEAVVIEVTAVLRHPLRGEYGTQCFVLGYLLDREFSLQRDAFAEPCSGSKWRNWQQGRAFESRWLAR